MSLKEELQTEVAQVFRAVWEERDGNVVPEANDIKLGNDAVKLEATVLYADLADSTDLVDKYSASFAAEIYKTFLHCAAKIIRSEQGTITAYDGDRIMAVYIGDSKNTSAARSALKIHWAVLNVINTAKAKQYPNSVYNLRHVIGIDTSNLFAARTGVRGANDLVWVGRSANYAAKLTTLPSTFPTYITQEVFSQLHASTKIGGDGRQMWEAVSWNSFDNRTIYRSNWWWSLD
jgi:class 3 adenylate cyclase